MKLLSDPRFLGTYAGIATLALAMLALGGSRKTKFEEITVERINVVEPDGTLRLSISNSAQLPALIVRGKEYRHKGRAAEIKRIGLAGLVFFDAEGTESGGLVFGGRKLVDGSMIRDGHLTFDHYDQDEALVLTGGQESDGRYSGLQIKDQPNWPIEELVKVLAEAPDEKRQQVRDAFFATHSRTHIERVYIGRRPDKSSTLELKDEQGRARIILKVGAEGGASLQFLDEKGTVIDQWPRPRAGDTDANVKSSR
ncbi:hypothetical protein [Pendulispora albinea]|uniref:Uncharacterized protein n=1 Tax=Pendulispora albinea TaxID=2741071 RepID=A0ABZ2LKB3_9BACT